MLGWADTVVPVPTRVAVPAVEGPDPMRLDVAQLLSAYPWLCSRLADRASYSGRTPVSLPTARRAFFVRGSRHRRDPMA
jgi:hypothetical protein